LVRTGVESPSEINGQKCGAGGWRKFKATEIVTVIVLDLKRATRQNCVSLVCRFVMTVLTTDDVVRGEQEPPVLLTFAVVAVAPRCVADMA